MWTNWTKIWSVLSAYSIEGFPQKLVKNDLIALLERKGFKEFSGFSIQEWNKRYSSFYKEIWFRLKLKTFSLEDAQFYNES